MQQSSKPHPTPLPHWWPKAALLILIAGIVTVLPVLYGHISDRQCWADWAGYIKTHGLQHAYSSDTDYPPLYQYALWALAKVSPGISGLGANVPYLRLLTLTFDLAGIAVVARWIERRHWAAAIALLSLVNLGFMFNTVVWGQVDGILSTLAFAALYAAWRGRMLVSAALFALALSFKVQTIVFLPLWGLLMLHTAAAQRRWGAAALSVPVAAGVLLLVCAVFLLTPESRAGLYDAFFGSVDRYSYRSMNAANLYYWTQAESPRYLPDTGIWLAGLSYKKVGLALFFGTSAAALAPILRRVWAALRSGGQEVEAVPPETVWLSAALIVLLFFFCNTQMHERYAHPALLPLTALAFGCRGYWVPYILASAANALQLISSMEFIPVPGEMMIAEGRTGAVLWGVVIVWLFVRLYGRKENKSS